VGQGQEPGEPDGAARRARDVVGVGNMIFACSSFIAIKVSAQAAWKEEVSTDRLTGEKHTAMVTSGRGDPIRSLAAL
jgi:hypothetical protein